jgi:hypothetical protein
METLRAGNAQPAAISQAEIEKLGTDGRQPVPAGAKATSAAAVEKEPDILLDSTTKIMGDIVAGIAPAAAPRAVAQRESQPEKASAN